jgi:hypothetical protein
MKCSTKYVGLDVHQATTVATVRESSGKIIGTEHSPHRGCGAAGILRRDAGRGAAHAARTPRPPGLRVAPPRHPLTKALVVEGQPVSISSFQGGVIP